MLVQLFNGDLDLLVSVLAVVSVAYVCVFDFLSLSKRRCHLQYRNIMEYQLYAVVFDCVFFTSNLWHWYFTSNLWMFVKAWLTLPHLAGHQVDCPPELRQTSLKILRDLARFLVQNHGRLIKCNCLAISQCFLRQFRSVEMVFDFLRRQQSFYWHTLLIKTFLGPYYGFSAMQAKECWGMLGVLFQQPLKASS